MEPEQQIFREGSKTYYSSTLLFPRRVREDVVKLYSFVRVADNYVDAIPQQVQEFQDLVATWKEYCDAPIHLLAPDKGDVLNVRVTKNICRLTIQHRFDPAWIDAFLESMESDTKKTTYRTLDDTLRYTYGSAEVIGFMMARLMDLAPEAMETAATQGRAMQYINFLRDIAEDVELSRCYFPEEHLKRFNLKDLKDATTKAHPDNFRQFVRFELGIYKEWQEAANAGIHYIPKRYRLPIQAAVDSYNWTAGEIENDPFVVYRRKVKPSKTRIIGNALTHVFD